MPLKLYTDGHIANAIVKQLRERNVDVVRCEEVGLKDADDIDHLNYAIREQRTIVTQDADFLRYHTQFQSEGKQHFGIIRINSDSIGDIGYVVNELHFLHEAIESEAANLENDVYNRVRFI
jgi:predicted nuclease of predicted toxin-antitoxin system